MDSHVHPVEHHEPVLTKKELKKNIRNWPRVTGHFILDMLPIIFGILIATGINSWREKRHEHKEEKFYLTSLQQGLIEDRKELETSISLYKEIKMAQRTLFTYLAEKKVFDFETIYPNITIWLAESNPRIESVSFKALQNTGKLNIIGNKVLLAKLISVYDSEVQALEQAIDRYYNYKRNALIPVINRTFLITVYEKSPAETQLKNLLANIEFRNALSQIPIDNTLFHLNQLLKSHSELILLVENELK